MLSKTIRISEETYKELARQGTLEDSYDKVIKRLIQIAGAKTKE
jgi:predicted CopG family antitoxin